MLTVSETNTDVAKAMKAGARGYVLKGVGSRALAALLHDVMAGESYVSPSLAANLLLDLWQPRKSGCELLEELTKRELEILRLVSEGDSNKVIGNRLSLQEKTVKHHMTRLMAKLKVRNRTEAAILVQQANAFADQV